MGVSRRKPSSYVVKIVGTEHGTWQGYVEHIQTGQKSTFRSCLEMLHAMEKTLGALKGTKDVSGHSELA